MLTLRPMLYTLAGCNYATGLGHNLANHRLFHYGKPAFQCSECGMSGIQRGNVALHMAKAHPGVPGARVVELISREERSRLRLAPFPAELIASARAGVESKKQR